MHSLKKSHVPDGIRTRQNNLEFMSGAMGHNRAARLDAFIMFILIFIYLCVFIQNVRCNEKAQVHV